MVTLKKVATPLIVLLCPLIYFIKFFHVPWWHPDIAVLITLTLCVSAAFSLLLWRAQFISNTLILTLLLVMALSFFPAFQSLFWFDVLVLTTLIVVTLLSENVLTLILSMASVFCILLICLPVGNQFDTVHLSNKENIKFNANLPPIIHIVLDEHIGVNAIPTDLHQGQQLQDYLRQFYVGNGFRLYENAYSRYSRTYDSIPNLLNFTTDARDASYFSHTISQLKQNTDFSLLSNMGYKIRVYQANYLDFCHAKNVNYESCLTYPMYSLPALYKLPLPWQQRTIYLLKSYLMNSAIYQGLLYSYAFELGRLLEKWDRYLPPWPWDQNQLATLLTFQALEQLTADVMQAPAGTVFFAHILLPHSPYVVDADCKPLPKPSNWLINYDYGIKGNTAERRELRYGLYENQMRCLYKQLQPMVTAWQQAGVWNNAMVIVQGDHSARLPVMTPLSTTQGKSTWLDFLDSYPTLYAVKAPGYTPGVDAQQLPITHLFGKFTQKISGGQPATIDSTVPFVFLTTPGSFTYEDQIQVPISSFKRAETLPAQSTWQFLRLVRNSSGDRRDFYTHDVNLHPLNRAHPPCIQ